MNAHAHGVVIKPLNREGIVDVRGRHIVDGVRHDIGQRKLVPRGADLDIRESGTFREVRRQEPALV